MMNSNKYTAKLTSIILCIMLLFSVMPAMAAGATETIFVRCDNLTLPENSAGWTYSASAADYYSMLNDGTANLPGIGTNVGTSGYDSTVYATAQIYVDGDNGGAKTYYVWAAGRSDGARPIYVAFDDSETFSKSAVAMATSGGMAWNNYADGFSLTPGFHTLKIRVGASNSSNFQGLLITDDANYAPTAATTYADITAIAVVDTAAPEFASDAAVETAFEGSVCTITFPEATDGNNTALYYEYTLNGSATPIVDIKESVNVGVVTEDTTVTLTVYDKLGHKAEKTFDIAAPELPALPKGENMLLSGENFTLSGNYSQLVSDGLTNKLFTSSVKVQRLDAVTAKIYVQESGNYAVWCFTGAINASTDRVPKMTIGSVTKLIPFSNELSWKKEEWTLSAGWNIISLTTNGEWLPYFFNALYITSDLTYEPDTASDDILLAFTDTTAPVIGDGALTTEYEGEDCIVTFPKATGGTNELILYEYTVDGNAAEIIDIAQPVNIGQISGDTTVTLTAYDKFGNAASKDFTVKAPEKPLESDGFMLTYENFDVPAFSNGGIVSGVTGALADSNIKVNGGDMSLYATAKFYVAEEGDYALWLYSGNDDDIVARHPVAYIDDQKDLSSFNATKTLTWNKGKGSDGNGVYHLSSGWHTVKLGLSGGWLPYKVNAVYITDDLTYEVTTANDDKLLKQQGDTVAPEFAADSVSVVYNDYTTCTLSFPEISDKSAVAEKLYYINDEAVTPENSSVGISNLKPLEKLSVKAEAYDKFGNKSVLEDEYLSTPVHTSSFALVKNSETTALENLSALKAGDVIKLDTKLTNRTAEAKTVELSICLYSAGYERMLLCTTSETALGANAKDVLAGASLTLPNDFVNTSGCIITAILWDKTSGAPYVEGIEIKGAEQ